jgi:hypothetical protein
VRIYDGNVPYSAHLKVLLIRNFILQPLIVMSNSSASSSSASAPQPSVLAPSAPLAHAHPPVRFDPNGVSPEVIHPDSLRVPRLPLDDARRAVGQGLYREDR